LSDVGAGSNCFFFVGCYRDNEVDQAHPIFDMMSKLDLCRVKSTKMLLCGLNQGKTRPSCC